MKTLLLCLCMVGSVSAWASKQLFHTSFSDASWSDITSICNSKNAENEIHNGITFHSYNSTAKPFTISQSAGTMTWCNNNMADKYWIAIPLTGVNNSITITVANGTSTTNFNYVIKQETTVSSAGGSGTKATTAAPCTKTISDLDKSDYVVYLGRAGSGQTTCTEITITTEDDPITVLPDTPTFTVDGGAVIGGSSTTIASTNATSIYYLWSDESTAPEVGDGSYTSVSGNTYEAIVPNVTATKYLHAYGSNNVGQSSIKTATFNVTKTQLANGLAYATTAKTLFVGDAAFTNELTNPNSLTVSYSITDNGTGTTIDTATGEVTPGSVAGTETITATFAGSDDYLAGNVTYTLTLNALHEQTDVTGSKTWNINTDVTADNDVDTGGAWKLYANITGLTLAETFDGTSLLVKASTGKTAYRQQYKCAQGASLKFHTTVPGVVTVTFKNPNSSSTRYLQINGTSVASSNGNESTNPTGSAIVLPGDVELTGVPAVEGQLGDLRFFKVEFEAVTSVSGTISASGWNTFSSNYALDLSTITGGTAYVATSATDGKVTMTSTDAIIDAGEGLMIKGTAGDTFTINTTAEDATLTGTNLLVGLPNGGSAPVDSYVFGWPSEDATAYGFYYVNTAAATLDAGKAYLNAGGSVGARLAISFDDETTGISNVEGSKLNVEGYYNLAGQRVAQPAKGLYIVNGKKVVVK